MEGEVDLPQWWQEKIINSKSMLVAAKHYLDFEMKEPSIDASLNGEAMEEGKKRDMNNDKKIDSKDYVLVRKAAIEKSKLKK